MSYVLECTTKEGVQSTRDWSKPIPSKVSLSDPMMCDEYEYVVARGCGRQVQRR